MEILLRWENYYCIEKILFASYSATFDRKSDYIPSALKLLSVTMQNKIFLLSVEFQYEIRQVKHMKD